MELTGEVLMKAPRERVWAALNDPAVLQICIPGCEEVQDESPTERRVRVLVKVGPVRARFQGRVTLEDADPPAGCVLAFEGSGGAAGMASGRSQVRLEAAPGGTRLAYTARASVGGKLGQIGGRMIDASAKQLADQFFAALRTQVEPPAPAAAETSMPAPAPSPALEPGAVTAAPVRTAAPAAPVTPLPAAAEISRVLWFLLGAASMGAGVWLGARIF